MHIIFGDNQTAVLKDKYTLLELDTFKFLSDGETAIAYAVVESIPIEDLPKLSFQTDLHKNLIENYRGRDWNFCEQAIEQLIGAFGGEIDTFYVELQNRINNYKENDPGDAWDYTITRLQK
jgi:hypothetical protein